MIDFLYTNIGRGHPHYLDGVIECLPQSEVGSVSSLNTAAKGISAVGWQLIRLLYITGGVGGPVASIYNKLRNSAESRVHESVSRLLGRGLLETFPGSRRPLVVAHHLLVSIMAHVDVLVYQHGEVVAPQETRRGDFHRVVVPLPSTADTFLRAGIPSRKIFVSGICVEPALGSHAEPNFASRVERLRSNTELCGAYFSSGAEPRPHVVALCATALSAHGRGGRVILFARKQGRFSNRCRRLREGMIDMLEVTTPRALPKEVTSRAILCLYSDRKELNEYTTALFPHFDYLVAPSHERTCWALGLGLPMYVVDPPIGSFAPLNREKLLRAGVAHPLQDIDHSSSFADLLEKHRRSGKLLAMADAGWGRHDLDGFANIAKMLIADY